MKIKRVTALTAVAGLAVAGLAACGSPADTTVDDTQSPTEGDGGSAAPASDIKACMVSSLGGLNDRSFNESTHQGFLQAESELGVEIAVVAPQSDADFTPSINNMVAANCDLIIGVGFLQESQMSEAAVANPDVDFALVDSTFSDDLPNAKPLLFDTAQASYLAGYLAAGMSETGRIGTFLGAKIPPTMIFADGFIQGSAHYNDMNDTDVQVLGWDFGTQDGMATGDFQDVARGQQFAAQLIEQGADVLMPVAGPVGTGALAAASATSGVSVIWVDSDGFYSEPDFADVILTSVLKQVGNAVYDTIAEYKNGQFTSDPYVGTLENDGVGIAPFHEFEDIVPQDLKDQLDEVRQQIIDGEIVVESPSAPRV